MLSACLKHYKRLKGDIKLLRSMGLNVNYKTIYHYFQHSVTKLVCHT